ncbi:MAG: hypothetical protein LBT48_06165 [Prevotellaceae bacterium]|jgi:hypothetical protein|nr:hypothetical protein [Prevotellaceae bacterium]
MVSEIKLFVDAYSQYQASGLDKKKIKQTDILSLIKGLPPLFRVEEIGQSFEGRTLFGIRAGHGGVRVLAWSQMHGDESTATRSLFDAFRFLAADEAALSPYRDAILSKLSLLFVPMVNPDGAERWQRENAQGIDVNRDARRGATPEGRLLQTLCRTFAPHFALNLHDQNSYYSAGVSRHPATFSFQAAPPDNADTVTPTRAQAMKLIVHINRQLQQILPQHVGRWNNDYEPRAFGEWFQAQQVATMLIESGGYPCDEERLAVRRFHFGIIIETLYAIAAETYANRSVEDYYELPLNRENGMFDRIERHTEIRIGERAFISDVGFRGGEKVTGDLDDYGALC